MKIMFRSWVPADGNWNDHLPGWDPEIVKQEIITDEIPLCVYSGTFGFYEGIWIEYPKSHGKQRRYFAEQINFVE